MTKYIDFIKKALSGDDVDYTKTSIRTAVLLLAIPMMLEMAMESVFCVGRLIFCRAPERKRLCDPDGRSYGICAFCHVFHLDRDEYGCNGFGSKKNRGEKS